MFLSRDKQHLPFTLLISFAMLFSASSLGDIVKWIDENGKVHYGDVVPEKYREHAETIDTTPANILESQHTSTFPKTEQTLKKEKKTQPKHSNSTSSALTNEKKCQKIYGISCDQVNNWEERAKNECLSKNGGKKCNDLNYLETKYKPRTLKEKRLQATRNSNRRKEEAKTRRQER